MILFLPVIAAYPNLPHPRASPPARPRSCWTLGRRWKARFDEAVRRPGGYATTFRLDSWPGPRKQIGATLRTILRARLRNPPPTQAATLIAHRGRARPP